MITVKNTGTDPITDLTVADTSTGSGTTSDLACDFTALGGPSTGTTWQGPLPAGATFECRAALTGVTTTHADTATVTGTGQLSSRTVSATDSYTRHRHPRARRPCNRVAHAGHSRHRIPTRQQHPILIVLGLLSLLAAATTLAAPKARSPAFTNQLLASPA